MALKGLRVVRALIASQTQVWLNTAFRNVGVLGSTLAITLAFGLFALITMLFVATCSGIGYATSHAVYEGNGGGAGAAFTVASFLGAFASVVTGDAHAFDWARLRRFPAESGWLFVAEMGAGLLHPVMLTFAAAQVGLVVGLCEGVRSLAPLALLTLALSLVVQVSLRMVMGSIVERLVRQARRVIVLVLLAGTALSWRFMSTLEPKLTPDQIAERLANLGEQITAWLTVVWRSLPASLLLEAGSRHGWSRVEAFMLPVLGVLALVGLSIALALREDGEGASETDATPERLWSFRAPVLGVARLQWLTLWRSDFGRMTLVTPVFALWPFIAMARLASSFSFSSGLDRWATISIWVMGALSSTNVLMNQFGLDRTAAKGLFLLPISDVQIVRGKALGYALFQSLQLAPVLVLTRFVMHAPWSVALGQLCMASILFVVQLTFGQWASVAWPRPLPRKGLRAPPGSLASVMASLMINATALVPLMAVWVVLGSISPRSVLPVLLLLLGLVIAAQWRMSHEAARWLSERRERVVEALG